MAKITLAKSKLSSDELDRMLGSDTTVDGCSATTKTESQRVNQWKKENRDTLRIDLPKGMKAEIQAEAKKRGCSVTTLIQRALASYCSDTTDQ